MRIGMMMAGVCVLVGSAFTNVNAGKVKCTSLKAARKAEAKAATAASEAYKKALAKAGLTPIGLPSHEAGGYGDYGDELPSAEHAPGKVTVDKGDGKKRTLWGPSGYSCPWPENWELVKNDKDELFVVDRRPNVVKSQTLRACGCPDHHWVCGGAAPYRVQIAYELPEGMTFKGHIEVKYDVTQVNVIMAGNADGSACPAPPPPPP